MLHTFKNLPLLFCLLAPSALSADETAVVIKPWTISFNYIDLGGKDSNKITKGIEAVFELGAAEGYRVESSTRMWFYEPESDKKVSLYLRDSKGNDLGDSTYAGEDEKGEVYYYLFRFPRFPSIGSESLEFLGKVPLRVLSCQTISPPQSLQIKEGAELFLDDLTVKVEIPEKEEKKKKYFEADFQFNSPNRMMKIIEMIFYDQDGQPLVDNKGNFRYSSGGGGTSYIQNRTKSHKNYRFTEIPDLLKVSVNYWAKVEEIELSIPAKLLFYDPEAEKADEKQK